MVGVITSYKDAEKDLWAANFHPPELQTVPTVLVSAPMKGVEWGYPVDLPRGDYLRRTLQDRSALVTDPRANHSTVANGFIMGRTRQNFNGKRDPCLRSSSRDLPPVLRYASLVPGLKRDLLDHALQLMDGRFTHDLPSFASHLRDHGSITGLRSPFGLQLVPDLSGNFLNGPN